MLGVCDGYYYAVETGFYYVSSRYYDPEVGRFISADTTDILGVDSDLYDKNLYAYCDNNPVMRTDANGELWLYAAGIITGVVAQYTSNVLEGVFFEGESLSAAMKISKGDIPGLINGAVSGMFSVMGLTAVGMATTNAVLNTATYIAECELVNKKIDMLELTTSVGVGMIMDGASKPFDSTRAREVVKTANKYIRNSASAKKRAMYSAKKVEVVKSVARNSWSTVKSASEGMVVSNFLVKAGRWLSSIFK